VSAERQAVFFNAVPLLVLAAVYLGVGAALLPTLWRERGRVTIAELALSLMFPCIGVPAAVLGALVVNDRQAIGGQVWPTFAATLIAFVPPALLIARWRDRFGVVTSGPRAREAEARVVTRDRELEAIAAISNALARSDDPETAGRVLLDEVGSVLGLEFVGLAVIARDGATARGLLARSRGEELDWWRDVIVDLRSEPSGIASAYFNAASVVVYDVESSTLVSRRVATAVGAKSAAFIPLIVEETVVGVLVVAVTGEKRAFAPDEVTLMETLAAEAALALERTRSASALDEALVRERLVAEISRRVRSVHDIDAVTQVAVTETGRALGASRCFIRFGHPGEPMPMRAEWFADGLEAIGPIETKKLPVSNLAIRERRTIAIEDVEAAAEITGSPDGRETLAALGTRSALATPIVAFDRMIGILGLNRAQPGPWSEADIGLAEAVAREVGLAIHTTSLLEENERRLRNQTALLRASQVLTSELELEAVLKRLVDEVAQLLECEAADCYLLESERGILRCAAVHGLPEDLIGFEFPAERGLAGRAIARGRPALSANYEELEADVPHDAYSGFVGAIVAPMTWSGRTRGVLGVGTRDRERTFSQIDAELLEAFAALASLALRNAESFEERSRQARTERGFYRIAAVLAQPLSLGETLNAVAQAATEALGGVAAAVLMPSGGELQLVGSYELPRAVTALLERGVGGPGDPLPSCARRGRILAAPKVDDDERFDEEWRRVLGKARVRSVLAVPVEAPREEEEGGLVLVFFSDLGRFSDHDVELGRNLAGAARGALERSELFESERRARALSQQLARTGALIAHDLDPAAVLDELVQQAPALIGADACAVRLLEGEEFVVSAAHGAEELAGVGTRAPWTVWLAGEVGQSRNPVVIPNIAGDSRLIQADPLLAAGHSAYLGVPLIGSEGALHGVLSVYSRRPRAWREEEVEALSALAANAAAGLSSAELYQRVALEKERSVAILANIADGIVAVDREGHVVLWNAAAERITGVPASEALGRTPLQVLQRNLEGGAESDTGDRFVSIRRGREEVWLSLTEAVMRDPAGAVAGRIFAFRDISAERAVEQMKSDFVSMVSHELRTPLTSIYGFAETLMRQDVLFGDEQRATFLGYIASESERLTHIVNLLLNVARLDTGDLKVQLTPLDVRAVVAEAVAAAEQGAGTAGHRFVVDLPEDPLEAQADAEKLRQILVNLLENAVKYSPGGGKVTIAARRRNDAVEVSVSDEGVGISEEDQRRVFTKFYRGDGQGQSPGGTGLGLFIAQGLVSAMGGRIWVDSREGEGSIFSFELPLPLEPVLSERE
jgi:PAS domain S-box-containing protein